MPSIGDRLAGRYRLDSQIGRGGFATVFRARDMRLERDVAVKVLHANLATDPLMAARFEREGRVLAAISHPNVVAVHDVGPVGTTTGAEPFLVMDLCSGGSLADRLAAAATGALPPDELVPILVDVAAGLEALHARGIVHRDIKPSNVLLADGRALIADLGIATAGPSELTAIGSTVGTLAFLAPEQLAGEPGSPASDVHALGVIAFLGLTGALPRSAGSVSELVAASVRPVDPVSARRPALGPAFDSALGPALASDPSRRPSAAELGAGLAAALEQLHAQPLSAGAADATTLVDLPIPRHTAAATDVTSAPDRDRRMVVAVGALLAALFLGLAAFLVLGLPGSGGGARPSVAGSGSGVSPSASARTAPTATSESTATSAPSATAPPTVDPYGNAGAASAELRAAIEGAQGSHLLKGREAKDLEGSLDRFDRALEKQDPQKARDEAGKLAGQVAALVDKQAVDAQAARLRAASERLVAAASALPD